MSPDEDDRVRPHPDTTDVVGARIGAQVVDTVLLVLQTVVVVVGLVVLFEPNDPDTARDFTFLAFITLPLYGGLLEGYWNGQTVGKRLLDIKVVDGRGRDPTFGQAVLRNVPAVVLFSWLTTAVALAMIATDDDRQRLFDLVAETYVVGIGSRRVRSR